MQTRRRFSRTAIVLHARGWVFDYRSRQTVVTTDAYSDSSTVTRLATGMNVTGQTDAKFRAMVGVVHAKEPPFLISRKHRTPSIEHSSFLKPFTCTYICTRRYMAKILPKRRKTLSNQSINQTEYSKQQKYVSLQFFATRSRGDCIK